MSVGDPVGREGGALLSARVAYRLHRLACRAACRATSGVVVGLRWEWQGNVWGVRAWQVGTMVDEASSREQPSEQPRATGWLHAHVC